MCKLKITSVMKLTETKCNENSIKCLPVEKLLAIDGLHL